jgi:2-polyprenyl-3-methyl-5-hydroxy-6-metoxy-1,4-benzoquinol methylase
VDLLIGRTPVSKKGHLRDCGVVIGLLPKLAQLRRKGRARAVLLADDASVLFGRAFTRIGSTLLLYPHRGVHLDVPREVDFGGRPIDIVQDLVEYTGLDRHQVEALLQRRHESFRVEWHARPQAVHSESWFYLSSRTYLFGNAVHDAGPVADELAGFMRGPSDVLDFGGGTGNLALALAARGHRVDYLERSALQKDFVRFRIDKHGLEQQIRILDAWRSLPALAYDLVCAMDVFEHIANLGETMTGILNAIRPEGLLAESSAFVRNTSNPMHHEAESEFAELMRANDFEEVHKSEFVRIWQAPAQVR